MAPAGPVVALRAGRESVLIPEGFEGRPGLPFVRQLVAVRQQAVEQVLQFGIERAGPVLAGPEPAGPELVAVVLVAGWGSDVDASPWCH
ncbi:MAG TPA: hypothetical protein ENJ55_01050 [Rhizobiales bacterium]|nr:hypothetical protein [Hyphomicrobiales bacterium]